MNGFRSSKLSYASILNITFFALTATTLIELLRLIVTPLGRVPYGFLGALLVTTAYLFLGIKQTELKEGPSAGQ